MVNYEENATLFWGQDIYVQEKKGGADEEGEKRNSHRIKSKITCQYVVTKGCSPDHFSDVFIFLKQLANGTTSLRHDPVATYVQSFYVDTFLKYHNGQL